MAKDAAPVRQKSYLEAFSAEIAELLNAPDTVELAVNADGAVWLETIGDAHMRRVEGRKVDPLKFGRQIAGEAALQISDKAPLCSAKMTYGAGDVLRAQVVQPPASDGGVVVSLRKFVCGDFTVADFKLFDGAQTTSEERRREILDEVAGAVARGDHESALKLCVAKKLNVLISGGTSTAKTSLARALIRLMPSHERIITIEDAVELMPAQANVVRLVAERKEGSARDAEALLQASLRLRPDRIVVGELRGAEAFTFLEAINTGHGGSISTIHAETPRMAIERMAMMVVGARVAMPYDALVRYIGQSLDCIVQLERRDGMRGVSEIFYPSLEA